MSRKKRICLVEDEKDFADIVKRLRADVNTLFMGDCELLHLQSLAMLKHVLTMDLVVLVVLDLTLPDSSQEASMAMIAREHREFPPIYVLTGDERMEVRDRCLLHGAAGFALKKHVIESPNFFFAELYNCYLKGLVHEPT